MLKNYINLISKIGNEINEDNLKRIISLIDKKIKNKNRIFVCGNGGSASLSDHALCDWTKRLYPKKKCEVYDLTSNKSLISAISNDISFENIFSYQIKLYAKKKDLCIFISSSGNSKNIIKGILQAKNMGIKTLAIVGFAGGKARKIADLCVHFPTKTYEHHEDLTQILMHYIYTKLK